MKSTRDTFTVPTTMNADEVKWRYMMHVLKLCDGNKSAAARRTGQSRWAFHRWCDGASSRAV